jgi:hypothetical protein
LLWKSFSTKISIHGKEKKNKRDKRYTIGDLTPYVTDGWSEVWSGLGVEPRSPREGRLSESNILGTRENRPENSSTSRLAAGRADGGHVTRLVHHRGGRDSEDGPRYSPGPPVGKEEPVTVGGPDPPSPRRGRAQPSPSSGGPGEPRPAKARGRGTRPSTASANRNARCPQLPPPPRIPGARVAFPQAAEAAPARPRFHPGSRALLSPGRGGGGPRWGESQTISRGGSGTPLSASLRWVLRAWRRARGRRHFSLLQTQRRRQRATRREDLGAAAPHPGTRGMAWAPRAGGWPRGRWPTDAVGLGARAGEGCRVAAGLPQPPPLPAQLLGDRAGEGGHSSHSSPRPSPAASIKLAADGSPALWLAPVGRGYLPAVAWLAADVAGPLWRHFRRQVCGPGRPWLWLGGVGWRKVGSAGGGEGRGGAGRRWQGGNGEPTLAACPCSARPTAAWGPGAAAGAGGSLRLPVLGQGEGSARAGGNCIPGDGVGDLQLGGTGNETGLLTGEAANSWKRVASRRPAKKTYLSARSLAEAGW